MVPGPLLDLLRRRYCADEIYTFTGNILISINPYRFIPGLYAIPALSTDDSEVIHYSRDHIPHVFTIAELSYDTMMRQVGAACGGLLLCVFSLRFL
jgi:myosin-5